MASVRVSRQARHYTRPASKRVNAANAASGEIDRPCVAIMDLGTNVRQVLSDATRHGDFGILGGDANHE
jgi:hypothetical protein